MLSQQMGKELLVLLSVTLSYLTIPISSANRCEGEATTVQCNTHLIDQLSSDLDTCLHGNLVQIVRVDEEGDEMLARVLTAGGEFKPSHQTTRENLFFLVTTPPITFDPKPRMMIVSCDGRWILSADDKSGQVTTEAVVGDGLVTHVSLPRNHFSLSGGLNNAQLLSTYGGVDIIANGSLQLGVAKDRYQVRVVTSVDTCSAQD